MRKYCADGLSPFPIYIFINNNHSNDTQKLTCKGKLKLFHRVLKTKKFFYKQHFYKQKQTEI